VDRLDRRGAGLCPPPARRLVWINGWDACDITMPFGGFKQSGFGRDRSLHALYKYADMKSVTISTARIFPA
jgi:gamma-glutamyl-gamma-aminobutyraldehyde dehydrogenase